MSIRIFQSRHEQRGLDVRLKIARQMAGGIGVVAVRDGVQKYLPERSWWKRRPTLPKDLSLREVR